MRSRLAGGGKRVEFAGKPSKLEGASLPDLIVGGTGDDDDDDDDFIDLFTGPARVCVSSSSLGLARLIRGNWFCRLADQI